MVSPPAKTKYTSLIIPPFRSLKFLMIGLILFILSECVTLPLHNNSITYEKGYDTYSRIPPAGGPGLFTNKNKRKDETDR